MFFNKKNGIDREKVVEALRSVPSPGSVKDIVSTGILEDLKTEGNNISLTLSLPSMATAPKAELNFACQQAILAIYPDAQVHVHLKTAAPTAQSGGNEILPQVKNIIAVASGKGGVGKSTVSVNLALGLKALGAKVGLLDADVYGPSIPTMLGLVGKRPLIKDILGKPSLIPLEAYGIQTMSIGFIVEPEQAVVLRGPRLGGIIRQFISECIWDDLDYLVIDLPPGTGDVQLTLAQTIPITGAVIVTTPQEVAYADALKALNMFRLESINIPILGVVENMAWFTPAELPNNKYFIFGEGGGKKLAKEAGSMLLGQIPLVQGIREGGDTGKPAVSLENSPNREVFLEIARNVARQTAVRNEMFEPTRIISMK